MTRRIDPDALALKRACLAMEQLSDVGMIAATLRFMWDRYLVHPPASAWWQRPDGKNPKRCSP